MKFNKLVPIGVNQCKKNQKENCIILNPLECKTNVKKNQKENCITRRRGRANVKFIKFHSI